MEAAPRSDSAPNSPSFRQAPHTPDSSILLEPPVNVQVDGLSVEAGETSNCKQSFSTTLELGCRFVIMDTDSAAVSETGPPPIGCAFGGLQAKVFPTQRSILVARESISALVAWGRHDVLQITRRYSLLT